MNGDEYDFPGDVYDLDGETRSGVYIVEAGPGKNAAAGIPLTLELMFTSGSSTFKLIEIDPKKLVELADWMKSVAQDIIKRESKQEKPQ